SDTVHAPCQCAGKRAFLRKTMVTTRPPIRGVVKNPDRNRFDSGELSLRSAGPRMRAMDEGGYAAHRCTGAGKDRTMKTVRVCVLNWATDHAVDSLMALGAAAAIVGVLYAVRGLILRAFRRLGTNHPFAGVLIEAVHRTRLWFLVP